MAATAGAAAVCRVLEEDAELAEAVPAPQRPEAAARCIARVVHVPSGIWHPEETASGGEGIGLLVVAGHLLRRVGVDGRYGAELLGQGDLLRPWQPDHDEPTLAITTGWRVAAPMRLAVLDEQFARRAARYPQLTGRLVGRAVARSRHLAVNVAIVHQARVDVRLQMLLWHLAARWGRVRNDGVLVPLRLTHSVLAELAAARRPTVTSALSDLARRGRVSHREDGWLLKGHPPGELLELDDRPTALYGAGTQR